MELHNCSCRLKFLSALVHLLNMVKLCVASNALFPTQALLDGQTLTSPNRMFKMGFFSPGSSNRKFLGIWYNTTPDVVVWVANRNHPVTDFKGLHLAMDGSGNLSITSRGGVVWSQNASPGSKNPILHLLDTGNLVLADEGFEVLSWQSFDHPTDTLLPGMKMVDTNGAGADKFLTSWRNSDDPSEGDILLRIGNNGLPQVVLYKGIKKLYRTGTWNGLNFSGTGPLPVSIFKPEMVFNEEKLVSMSEPYDDSLFSRIVVKKSGSVQHQLLNSMKDKWIPVKTNPEEPCEEYNYCGPFSICTPGPSTKCHCLSGFIPKSQKDWDLHEWLDGCTRRIPLNCERGDHKFVEVSGIMYPDMLDFRFWLNISMGLDECRALCLTKCDCIAYANPYITNGGSGCVMWFGELIDTKRMSGANEKQKIFIRLSNLERGSSISKKVEEKNTPMISILISIVSGVLFSCFINGAVHYVARRVKQARTADEDLDTTLYKLSVIMVATREFSKENLLGEGGFGPVYKGNLSAQEEIAVKRLSGNSNQGLVEFKNEVMLIAKLQHRNLVKLLGCCIERGERILIYEYMQNKSLDTFVFDQNRRLLLPWPNRFHIIMGIARGLLYLHHDSRLKIIHRDLKTSNILLDGNLNPKISDFGLARIFEEDQLAARTKKVAGTYGYMSPEYAIAGKFSTKSDIFSFGVVMLEIVSGKRNRPLNSYQCFSLLENAWLLWKENDSLKLMDECLENSFVESQVKRCVHVGLLCVQRYSEDRPDMISVYSMLSTDEGVLPDPKEPGFFFDRSSSVAKRDASTCIKFENGTISISDLEAR